MEFFKIVDVAVSEAEIKERILNEHISQINPDIILLNTNQEFAQVGCLWGEFTLKRDIINGGIRYGMLECPNALAWTITTGYPPAREKIVLHLTINRERKKPEFIEEIKEFIDSWAIGLEAYFGKKV